jgi:hypothetical protein
MAYAGFRFSEKLIRALNGQSGIVEPTFVYLPGIEGGAEIAKITGCDFFSVPVELGVSSLCLLLSFFCVLIYMNSRWVPTKLSMSSRTQTAMRRSCLKLATRV